MQSWLAAQELQNAFYDVMHLLRSNFLAKFYFAEAAGIWLAPVTMARSFFPTQWQKLMQQLKGNRSQYFLLDLESNSAVGLSLETRATMAAGALQISLVRYLYRHRSRAEKHDAQDFCLWSDICPRQRKRHCGPGPTRALSATSQLLSAVVVANVLQKRWWSALHAVSVRQLPGWP